MALIEDQVSGPVSPAEGDALGTVKRSQSLESGKGFVNKVKSRFRRSMSKEENSTSEDGDDVKPRRKSGVAKVRKALGKPVKALKKLRSKSMSTGAETASLDFSGPSTTEDGSSVAVDEGLEENEKIVQEVENSTEGPEVSQGLSEPVAKSVKAEQEAVEKSPEEAVEKISEEKDNAVSLSEPCNDEEKCCTEAKQADVDDHLKGFVRTRDISLEEVGEVQAKAPYIEIERVHRKGKVVVCAGLATGLVLFIAKSVAGS